MLGCGSSMSLPADRKAEGKEEGQPLVSNPPAAERPRWLNPQEERLAGIIQDFREIPSRDFQCFTIGNWAPEEDKISFREERNLFFFFPLHN